MSDLVKQNTMIADFMGWIHHEDKDYDTYEMTHCEYAKNWSSLMPVVDKIETLQGKDGRGWVNYVVSMDSTYCVVSLGGEGVVADFQGETRIECTYNAVLRFIEYWNEDLSKQE